MPAATPRASHQCSRARVRRCLRLFFRHLFSNLGLFALVAGYVLLGALLFEFLEAGYELQQRGHIQHARDECLKELWLITERLNVLYEQNWTRLVHEQLRKFETSVVAATKMDGYDGKDIKDADQQWSFSGALLYCVTVITTIGYGNLSPKTSEGKVVTMLYALIGVPLMLLCLSNLGSLLAGTFQFAYSHACCDSCDRQTQQTQQTQQQQQQQQSNNHHHHHHLQQQQEQQQELHHQQHHQQQQKPKAVGRGMPVPVPVPAPLTCTINPRARARPRPLGPDVRKLLAECAEYSLAQDADPGAARVLRELRRGEPDDAAGDGERPDAAELEHDDAEAEHSVVKHDTPSRVPLIWRPPDDQPLHKRPPTPPPRRPKPDVTEPAAGAACGNGSRRGRRRSQARVPVSIVLLVLVLYICLGAAVFAAWEEWTFLDGAYFCFITLSTIGFGDMVPGKSFQRTDTQDGQLKLVACCAYLILGLVLIAMSFNLVQEEVLAKCRQVALYVGILKRVEHR